MRMWNVNPKMMCRQHLLGEHLEMHMFVGCINKGISIAGYVVNGLVDVGLINQRHEELSKEMAFRGMRHNSPLQDFHYGGINGCVDPSHSLQELYVRCSKCRDRRLNRIGVITVSVENLITDEKFEIYKIIEKPIEFP